MLKPIGTEFEHIFDPDMASTDTRRTKVKYRVVVHTQVQNLEKPWETELVEELEAIESEYVD